LTIVFVGDVDAGSADHSLLDHHDAAAGGRHLRRESLAALAPADNSNLKVLNRHGDLPCD
jgi:hypothetical protein